MYRGPDAASHFLNAIIEGKNVINELFKEENSKNKTFT